MRSGRVVRLIHPAEIRKRVTHRVILIINDFKIELKKIAFQ